MAIGRIGTSRCETEIGKITKLLRKHGGKTAEELEAEGK